MKILCRPKQIFKCVFSEISTICLAIIYNTSCTIISEIRGSLSPIPGLTPKCEKDDNDIMFEIITEIEIKKFYLYGIIGQKWGKKPLNPFIANDSLNSVQ